mmetsp:Transcript_4227/g.11675  ORF Transcript_4227/g.11675 Transcript_4227/m.11675 type:complete len:398 (-) Transcript_4227:22-1215(-)
MPRDGPALRSELLGVRIVVRRHVPAAERNVHEAVNLRTEGGPVAVHRVAATWHAAHASHYVHPLILAEGDGGQPEAFLHSALVALEAVEPQLLLLLHEPGLHHQVLARLGLVGVAHKIVAEDNDLVLGKGQQHVWLAEVLPRMELEAAAPVVHEVHDAHPPALDEVQVALDETGVNLGPLQRPGVQHLPLIRPFQRHPDHRAAAVVVGPEAKEVLRQGVQGCGHLLDLVVVVLHRAVGGVVLPKHGNLAAGVAPQVRLLELRLGQHEVLALSGSLHRLPPDVLAVKHLNDHVALLPDRAGDPHGELLLVAWRRPSIVVAALLRIGPHELPEVRLRQVQLVAIEGAYGVQVVLVVPVGPSAQAARGNQDTPSSLDPPIYTMDLDELALEARHLKLHLL